jgi:MinD superfamily P-loop ATPase
MNEITILSGKGGTGKTSITAALASLFKNTVYCDCDVDAADLHLLLKPETIEKHVFAGAWEAKISQDACKQCGLCAEKCRFGAIHKNGNTYTINPYQCEGCRLCERICPSNAIHSKQSTRNTWMLSNTRLGKLVHAQMAPGEENSGKLVAKLRNKARETAQSEKLEWIINDGPPGIGCTAISSITGANHIVLVIEPSLSGLHDAKRVVQLANGFNISLSAIINKFDLNLEITKRTENFLKQENIALLGKIPFNKIFIDAMIHEKTIIEYRENNEISAIITTVYDELKNLF